MKVMEEKKDHKRKALEDVEVHGTIFKNKKQKEQYFQQQPQPGKVR